MWKIYETEISVSINKRYWSTATPIHLHIVCGFSEITTAELLWQRPYGPQSLESSLLGFFDRKKKKKKFAYSCSKPFGSYL